MVALITGITGQDGFYLAHLLHGEGVEVWGTTRSAGGAQELPFAHLIVGVDLTDQASLEEAIARSRPDEIYHLAARSSVAASWNDPVTTADITGLGTLRLLEAARRVAPASRIFVASSSEVFGNPTRAPQDERTPLDPVSPYGVAKAFAQQVAAIYCQRHGLFVAVGILYNHESPRRPESFVTQKIVRGAAGIARGEASELRLGNLDARRDWGYAGDYVRAMPLTLQHPTPGDFVIATGETHSVRDWCDLAFAHFGLDYREYVVSDEAFWRPEGEVPLVGDASKAKRELGWTAAMSFADLVREMLRAEVELCTLPRN